MNLALSHAIVHVPLSMDDKQHNKSQNFLKNLFLHIEEFTKKNYKEDEAFLSFDYHQ